MPLLGSYHKEQVVWPAGAADTVYPARVKKIKALLMAMTVDAVGAYASRDLETRSRCLSLMRVFVLRLYEV